MADAISDTFLAQRFISAVPIFYWKFRILQNYLRKSLLITVAIVRSCKPYECALAPGRAATNIDYGAEET